MESESKKKYKIARMYPGTGPIQIGPSPCPSVESTETPSAFSKQVGGDHYQGMSIQPIEFIMRNSIPYCEGNVIKYICRYARKNGKQDLDKVIHYVELLKEFHYAEDGSD